MDGARLFNAAAALNKSPREICRYADTVMFCLSKGLGAPMGSLLCCNEDFAAEAVKTKKLLGGNMRQAGVMAACGLYALKHNIPDLKKDHKRAKRLASELRCSLKKARVVNDVQTNIIVLDVSRTGLTAEAYIELGKQKGIWMSQPSDTHFALMSINCLRHLNVLMFFLSSTHWTAMA